MGIGDSLMATSQVKAMNKASGLPVLILGQNNRIIWSEVFENNPKILRYGNQNCTVLHNGPGMRPYIAAKYETRWVWKKWDIQPGEVFLTDAEKKFAEPYRNCVLIEPHTKVADGNKAWPWERWQALVNEAESVRFVQTGPFNTRYLEGVEGAVTTFRQAMAILSVASAFVGTEGALHHAAAALGTPAVVLWSEFISPEFTGYESQRNIRHASSVCGARVPCVGCKLSMEMITVEEVLKNLSEVL